MKERKTETGTASNIAQNSLWECFCAILQIEGITLPAEKGAACQAGAVDFAGIVVARRFCPCLAQDICQNLLPCFAA